MTGLGRANFEIRAEECGVRPPRPHGQPADVQEAPATLSPNGCQAGWGEGGIDSPPTRTRACSQRKSVSRLPDNYRTLRPLRESVALTTVLIGRVKPA
jgi:hypothetical protein